MTLREEKAPYYLAHLGYRMDDPRHPVRQAEMVAAAAAAGPPPKKDKKREREEEPTAALKKAAKRYGVGEMVKWKDVPDPKGEREWAFIRAATYKWVTDLLNHAGMVKAYYEYSKTKRPFSQNVEQEVVFLQRLTEWVTGQEDWTDYRARQGAVFASDNPQHYDKTRLLSALTGETVAVPVRAPAAVPLPPQPSAFGDLTMDDVDLGFEDDLMY